MTDASAEAGGDRPQDVKWFARIFGMELGPMPWADLAELVQSRELNPSDEIRRENDTEWTRASQNTLLFPSAGSPPRRETRRTDSPSRPRVDPLSVGPGPTHAETTSSQPRARSVPVPDQIDETSTPSDITEDDMLQMLAELPDAVSEVPPPRARTSSRPRTPPPIEASPPVNATRPIETPPPPRTNRPEGPPAFSPADHPPAPPQLSPPDLAVVSPAVSFEGPPSRSRLPAGWPKISAAVLAIVGLLWFLFSPSYEGARVTGRVTLDGAPLRNATVTFYDSSTGVGASARLSAEGGFELSTQRGGILPGRYVVYVYSKTPDAIPERYLSLKTSDLAFDVPGDGSPIEVKLVSD